MAELRDVLAFFCRRKGKHQMSLTRLTQLAFLADWRSALVAGRQLTDVDWTFQDFGPYNKMIQATVETDPAFDVQQTTTRFGEPKLVVDTVPSARFRGFSSHEKSILDWVIKATKDRDFDEMRKLVYSTFPILSQEKGTQLDLVALARQYRAIRTEATASN